MTDNVTPIRAGISESPAPPRKRRAKRPPKGLLLRESDDNDGFSTLDVVNGLQGVCVALDNAAVSDSCQDAEHVGRLSMAARVLSSIVANRVDG